MSDRLKMPPERDCKFYQRRKHDKWREVEPPNPTLEALVADSHAHIHMLPDPAWELARCAANGVGFVCMIVDPSEDGSRPFDELDAWCSQSREELRAYGQEFERLESRERLDERLARPDVRIAVGVHPHNAKLYDETIERELLDRLRDPQTVALGEIGLDYHYDLSPRETQRRVFRRQIELAKELGLPIALHLRGGADEDEQGQAGDASGQVAGAERRAGGVQGQPAGTQPASNAHREAFEILQEAGFPEKGTLLHCCALPPDELRPWIEAGCYIAYGGAITFKNAEAAREGVRLVPEDRLLLETDAPYMTPEPMRGAACTPAHVVFTAAAIAEVRGVELGESRRALLQRIYDNTLEFYGAGVD